MARIPGMATHGSEAPTVVWRRSAATQRRLPPKTVRCAGTVPGISLSVPKSMARCVVSRLSASRLLARARAGIRPFAGVCGAERPSVKGAGRLCHAKGLAAEKLHEPRPVAVPKSVSRTDAQHCASRTSACTRTLPGRTESWSAIWSVVLFYPNFLASHPRAG